MSTNGQTAAGVTVPDTKLAREATELVRESTTDLVYHHSGGSTGSAACRAGTEDSASTLNCCISERCSTTWA
jgi:hypothetical protein